MDSYLKLEIFAYELFQTVWLKYGLISHKKAAADVYKDEYLCDSGLEEVYDKLFYNAVLCRRILFQNIFMEEIMKQKDNYWNSVSDFYNYILKMFKRHEWFGCLTVFEKMFATCAFVINLCFYNRENENVDIIICGHKCWAMNFDLLFIDEFYGQGGWTQLKEAARSYSLPLTFLKLFLKDPDNALSEVAESIKNNNNNNNLKQTSIIDECETVSKQWAKSCADNLYESNDNRVQFSGIESCFHAEYILNELKRLCSPCILEILEYDAECSERRIFDSDSFYIPLISTESQESMNERYYTLPSAEGIDAFSTISIDDDKICSETESNDKYLINQSKLKDHEDSIRSKNSVDIRKNIELFTPPILPPPPPLLSFNLHSEDQSLSRSMRKKRLKPESLGLKEATISEMDSCSNTNDSYSEEEANHVKSTSNHIHIPPKMTNNQCKMIEDDDDEICSEIESDDEYLINQSKLKKHEDSVRSKNSVDIKKIMELFTLPLPPPPPLLSFNLHSEDQSLSRSMRKKRLKPETLGLKEATISEMDSRSETKGSYSEEENNVKSTSNHIHIPQKMTNNQCRMIEDSMDVFNLANELSATAGISSHNNGFDEGEI